MGKNRGGRGNLRGKFSWKSRKANRGRKPALGKRAHFMTWPEVRAKMKRNATQIITPAKAEAEQAEAPVQPTE